MKITSKELVSGIRGGVKDYICEEILSSLTSETIHSPIETEEDGHIYEVKLLINGIEVEPKLLQRIYAGIEKIVDDEAAIRADNKLKEALHSIDMLHGVIKEAEYKIREQFNIEDQEY